MQHSSLTLVRLVRLVVKLKYMIIYLRTRITQITRIISVQHSPLTLVKFMRLVVKLSTDSLFIEHGLHELHE